MADNYTILSQNQSQELSQSMGGFQEVWNITYKVTDGSAKGTVGTVTVPEADHNAVAVKAAIEAKISDLSDIASLGGS